MRTVHGSLMKWQRMKCVFALLTVVLVDGNPTCTHVDVPKAECKDEGTSEALDQWCTSQLGQCSRNASCICAGTGTTRKAMTTADTGEPCWACVPTAQSSKHCTQSVSANLADERCQSL